MAAPDYTGKVFGLAHKRCVFMDVIREEKLPKGYHKAPIAPRIIDKKKGPEEVDQYKEYLVNDTGAFILRFVLDRVDSNLVAQIYKSEYGLKEADAKEVVNGFIDELVKQKLLKVITKRKKKAELPRITKAQKFKGLYNLNFDVNLNQMGSYRIKIFI